MSFFTNPFKVISDTFESFANWWKGTTIGAAIDSDAQSAKADIEKLSVEDAEQAGITIGTAALQGLATGGAAGAFAAGVAAAPAALKAAENDISAKTINTVVTTVVNQLQAQHAAASDAPASTPAPAAA
jgi:hypothetical protein